MNKFFSIVTPVYNRSTHLEQTIKSVLSQKFKNYEYFLIDGKSKDRTKFIINKYKSKINIISEKDNGMYDAINKGFKLSKGRYLLWINSDDFFIDDKSLLRAYNYLKHSNNDWITMSVAQLNERNNKIKKYFPLFYPRLVIKKGLAHSCFWGFIQQENTIFSKKLYEKSGGLNIKFKQAGDYDLWKKFSKYRKLISVPIFFAVQRKWSGQLTKDMNLYYKEMEKKKCLINIFYFLRLFYSLILMLYFFIRNIFSKQK